MNSKTLSGRRNVGNMERLADQTAGDLAFIVDQWTVCRVWSLAGHIA
jgi:hypothetical protein